MLQQPRQEWYEYSYTEKRLPNIRQKGAFILYAACYSTFSTGV